MNSKEVFIYRVCPFSPHRHQFTLASFTADNVVIQNIADREAGVTFDLYVQSNSGDEVLNVEALESAIDVRMWNVNICWIQCKVSKPHVTLLPCNTVSFCDAWGVCVARF